MITDLIFDFYGTLVNYSPTSIRNGDRKAYEHFIAEHDFVAYEKFCGLMEENYSELVHSTLPHHDEFCFKDIAKNFARKSITRELDDKQAHAFGHIHVHEWNEGTQFIDGMPEFINRLSKNYRLSIISNTHCTEIVMKNLRAMGITDKFEQITTSIDFGKRKPHASIFEYTLSKLGAKPSQSIFIGDTYTDDFLASKAVGMKSYLIDPEKKRKELGDERLDHVFELEKKLKV